MSTGLNALSIAELRERLQALCSMLSARTSDPPSATEIWIICPRAHVERCAAFGLRIPPSFDHNGSGHSVYEGKALFRMFDRFHDGQDLVYAVAPSH